MPNVDLFVGFEGFVIALIVAKRVPFLCPTAATVRGIFWPGYAYTEKVSVSTVQGCELLHKHTRNGSEVITDKVSGCFE